MARRAVKAKKAGLTQRAAGQKRGTWPARGTLAGLIAVERRRLQKGREGAMARKERIESEIAEIERELNAMEVFLSARHAKPASKGAMRRRARRGAVRQNILELIKSVPDGLTRGEIIQKLNAAEKSAQQSISNALSNLFKQKALTRKDRKYLAA